MKTAIFHNFTSKPYTGYWDGKPKTFKPGDKKLLPDYLAAHYAKHLTNQVLTERGDVTSTSPKFPEQVPIFMDVFNQAYIPQDDDDADDVEMPVVNKTTRRVETTVDANQPQDIPPVDGDDEDFEGLDDKSSELDDKE